MKNKPEVSLLSPRLLKFVNALPLKPGIRVLEIGCGSGAVARYIANTISDSFVLAIDRSDKAIRQAEKLSTDEICSGKLEFRKIAVEDFAMTSSHVLFDLAIAIRVGALDGRHPEIEQKALSRIANALSKNGKLFIDSGDSLKEVSLKKYR